MPYSRLLQQGKIGRYKAKPQEIEQLFQVAERDLKTADRINVTKGADSEK